MLVNVYANVVLKTYVEMYTFVKYALKYVTLLCFSKISISTPLKRA